MKKAAFRGGFFVCMRPVDHTARSLFVHGFPWTLQHDLDGCGCVALSY